MSGGAALFFYLRPSRATIADINPDLIAFYSVLKRNPEELLRRLRPLKASRDLYYAFRASRPRSEIQRAVRFAYLTRLAWNGLYRVNRRGDFNVPIGDRLPPVLWDESNLRKASAALALARIMVADFRMCTRSAAAHDFVFFDPPYPRGSRDDFGFNRYASTFFTLEDHRDLAQTVVQLSRQSVQVMVTLADVECLDKTYPQFPPPGRVKITHRVQRVRS
jgi:DNA adenine methylase